MAGENDLELRIQASAQQAITEFEKLGAAGAKGGVAIERAAAQAGVALDKMEKEAREAAAAGVQLSDQQQKAFNDLRGAYDTAIQKAGAYRAAQDDVRKATAAASASIDGQVRPINSVGDAFDRMGGKIGKVGGILTAVVATFQIFYDWTTRLRDKINEFTDGALDKLIQKAIALNPLYRALGKLLGEDLTDATGDAIQASDKLGTSLEGQAQFAKKAAEATAEAVDPLKDFAKESEAVAEATEKSTKATTDLGDAADKSLPKVADGAKAAAEEARGLAKALQDSADAAKKAHADAAAREGAAAGNLEDIKKRRQELAGKDVLSPEELNEQSELVGKQAAAEQELAKAHGDTTAKTLDLNKANQGLVRSFDALGDAASKTGDIFGTALQKTEQFLPAIARGSEDLDAGAASFTIYADAAGNAADSGSALAQSLQDIGQRLEVNAGGATEAEKALDDLGDTASEVGDAIDDTAEKTGDLGDELEEAGEKGLKAAKALHEQYEVLKTDQRELIALAREYGQELQNFG